jgi:radical SAM-linked protein
VQRLRLTFGKLGSMALIGHLDLVRLFDRAIRRADIPISFTGGYHPGPRISPANALPLGATSSGEIADFELKTAMAPEAFLEQLAAQLPDELPLFHIEEISLDAPAATKVLEQAEYYLVLGTDQEPQPQPWQPWIESVWQADTFLWEKTTKSGKPKTINLRQWLYQLEWIQALTTGVPEPVSAKLTEGEIVIRFIGSCRNDGTLLRPEHVVWMLEQVAQKPLQLRHGHRSRLMLKAPD